MRFRLLAAVAACTAILPGIASADPGPASEVYSPAITAGLSELEVRSGFLNGGSVDGEWQAKAEISHGFTEWWRPALVFEWEDAGGDTAFTAFAIENVFDFTATRDWPVHLGGYAEYEFAEDGPDAVELKLLMQRARGPLDLRLNLIGERNVGRGAVDEWEFGYAAQAAYALNEDFALGVQGFGDAGVGDDVGLDNRAQYWGPFAQFEAGRFNDGELELQLGYLAGFGAAEADGLFRVKLEYEFGGHDTDE